MNTVRYLAPAALGLPVTPLPGFVTTWLAQAVCPRVVNAVSYATTQQRHEAARWLGGVLHSEKAVAAVLPWSVLRRGEGLLHLLRTRPVALLDLQGCFIPGIGTPLAVVVGGQPQPTLRRGTCLRGEPSQPRDPSRGLVWSELVAHWSDAAGWRGECYEVQDVPARGWWRPYAHADLWQRPEVQRAYAEEVGP
jgi:hypothetical protein